MTGWLDEMNGWTLQSFPESLALPEGQSKKFSQFSYKVLQDTYFSTAAAATKSDYFQ